MAIAAIMNVRIGFSLNNTVSVPNASDQKMFPPYPVHVRKLVIRRLDPINWFGSAMSGPDVFHL
jgi:hypothetical protein